MDDFYRLRAPVKGTHIAQYQLEVGTFDSGFFWFFFFLIQKGARYNTTSVINRAK